MEKKLLKIKETQVIIHEKDLKKICKLKGMSVKKLAKLAKVDYCNLNEASNGHHIITMELWNKISQFI